MASSETDGYWNQEQNSVDSLTQHGHRKAKRDKRRSRRSKYPTSTGDTTKESPRTALDTMTLQAIRKIPSMSVFTWQRISEQIETQMSKIDLEETGVKDENKRSYSKELSDLDMISEPGKRKRHRKTRKVYLKSKDKKTKTKLSSIQRSTDNDSESRDKRPLSVRDRMKKRQQTINDTITKQCNIGDNKATEVEGSPNEEAHDIYKDGYVYSGRINYVKESSNDSSVRHSPSLGSDTRLQYHKSGVASSPKRSILVKQRKSTKQPGKTVNHVRFKVRLAPVNAIRDSHTRHSDRKLSSLDSYRQVYSLPKLALPPANMIMNVITVRNTGDFPESEDTRNVSKEVRRGMWLRDRHSDLVYKRSKSEVFKRFREYYSKRPHVTVS